MTYRDYVTDEAELLHDIRELLAILVYATINPPDGLVGVTDPQVRLIIDQSINGDAIREAFTMRMAETKLAAR